jgi:hypothetical protein
VGLWEVINERENLISSSFCIWSSYVAQSLTRKKEKERKGKEKRKHDDGWHKLSLVGLQRESGKWEVGKFFFFLLLVLQLVLVS